jgi:hypothetical protein
MAAIVAVVVVVVGVVVFSGNDDGDDATPPTTAAPTDTTEPPDTSEPTDTTGATDTTGPTDTGPPGEVTFPLSFSEAVDRGLVDQIDWGERCDTERGRVAVPDFFAPECYAPFDGDNGGATEEGVTGDTIKIVIYQAQDSDPVINYITDAIAVQDTNDQEIQTFRNMARYFETYYETYGRTVEIVQVVGSGIASDAVAARADAVRVAEEIKPFMVWGGPALTDAWGDEITARGIACISCVPGQPAEWYAEKDPLVWAIDASSVQKQAHTVEFVGKQLAGKNAEHAGDPAFREQPRKFGLLYLESSGASSELADDFVAAMAEVGAPIAERVAYALDPATIQQTAAQAIARLKAAGITTIIFSGDPVAPRDFTREATAQNYFPEWVVSASTLVDTTAFARTYDQEQWKHAFGVTSLNARILPDIGGYYFLHKWFTGEEPPAPDTIGVNIPPMALFYAVLQNTGPELTRQSWRDALVALQGTQQAVTQPYLSWGDKGHWDWFDYHGIDDATIIWWDPDATGPDEIRKEGTGMWRYVDGGRRYLPGEWPTEEKLFDPEGAVDIYRERPADETPPPYPSPAG